MNGEDHLTVPCAVIEIVPWLTDLLQERRSGRAQWRMEIRPQESVRGLLVRLHESHPRLAQAVYSLDEDRVTGLVNLLLNDRALELAGGLDAQLHDGDRVVLVPAYAGG
ncbi:MAG: MoaD/ThiS family protein [Chloroflexi bacterium]|nr:MoaD/ThiS family protein [Chloroflexota bacterium]